VRNALYILTFVAAITMALPVFGQTGEAAKTPPGATTQPVEKTPPAPATKPADDLSKDKGLAGMDENMTPEQIDALVKKANENRLKEERKSVAADLGSQFYDPNDVDKAVAVLNKDAKNTQKDNIDHICQAYAGVDKKFGNLYKLYNDGQALLKNGKSKEADGKFKEAVAVGKVLVNAQSTFLSAAKSYVYSMALEAAGMNDEAADSYTDLVQNMPDRISFASESTIRLADLYERTGRKIYAMQTYAYMLKAFGVTMDEKSFDKIYARVKELQQMYGDPMGTVAKMMSDVKERLAVKDSGDKTQNKEKDIIAMLDDLIKTEEDKAASSPPPPQNAKKKPGDKKGDKPGQGEGEKEGDQPGKGKLPSKKPAKKPTSGAPKSVLRDGGDAVHGEKASATHSDKEKGDWATLPPEQREKLEELRKQSTNERYRDIIIDYRRALADPDRASP
jgi:tetratricopeptide (TPR) repeat protein